MDKKKTSQHLMPLNSQLLLMFFYLFQRLLVYFLRSHLALISLHLIRFINKNPYFFFIYPPPQLLTDRHTKTAYDKNLLSRKRLSRY